MQVFPSMLFPCIRRLSLWLFVLVALGGRNAAYSWQAPKPPSRPSTHEGFGRALQTDKLVAWCVVPFDAKKRSPAERAAMLKQLGLKRCAYDWRAEHVATFEDEILQYKKQGIEFFAFWGEHPQAFELFKKHDIHPQIWRMMSNPAGDDQAEKVAIAASALTPLAKQARSLGCPLGIYNHGGWSGEPANMVAVCRELRDQGFDNVGIVYNFHHGHEHMERWPALWKQMQPYILCLNINGMNPAAQPKILGLGQGRHELRMLEVVQRSGYKGPIGILDHRSELDAKESLQENLDGLAWLRAELKAPGSGGAKPTPPVKVMDATQFNHSLVVEGKPEFRNPPITIACRATLPSKANYNILLANETKQSPSHWELFTVRGSGELALYIPGSKPDHVHTKVDICDGKARVIRCIYEPQRVRIYVNQNLVADEVIQRSRTGATPGGLAVGRLVEGGLGCSGHIDWACLFRGAREQPLTDKGPNASSGAAKTLIQAWTFPAPTSPTSAARPQSVPYDPALVRRWLTDAQEKGDVLRGARVFATAKFACVSCHQVEGHGGIVGPRLDEVAPKRKPEQLVESLLWPRREVAPEFQLWQAIDADGERRQGYLVQSNDVHVQLKDPATTAVQTIPRKEIARLREAGTLMPDGLTQAMTEQQQLDVIKFVLQLGNLDNEVRSQVAMAIRHAQQHKPAEFKYSRGPINPSLWPHADHPVNRDRIYDFYAKQARHFRDQSSTPMLLSAFPGLDGGQQGHWGNQNEETWADGRWNDVSLGTMQAGVFRGAGKTVARGICLKLGDNAELSACFDPDTLSYAAVWSEGFVEFSSVRHGFMHGLKMVGKPRPTPPALLNAPEAIRQPADPAPSTSTSKDKGPAFRYHGFYRHGKRVIFSYSIGGAPYLDAPWCEDGEFVRVVAPRDQHPLRSMLLGGERQWPQSLDRPVELGQSSESPYVVDTFALPTENPWNTLLFCGGHDFLANGDAMIATMHGDVWRVEDRGKQATWQRFASGLHHLQGLVIHNDQIYVQGRDQLTRLHDLNGDGEADFYECFSNAFDTSSAGHDFICGLERDEAGRFYTASGNQGLLRISADGQRAEVLATGFRNPDGLGLTRDGMVTVPCSEGSWTPASQICAFTLPTTPGRSDSSAAPYFGFGGPQGGRPALPLAYLPRNLDNSSGGQLEVTSDRWGPVKGAMLHFSFGGGRHFLLLRDRVKGQWQGAVAPLPGDFRSGVHRGRFHPIDGQLYVTGMAGWGSYTPDDGCFQRVRYVGDQNKTQAVLPIAWRAHQNGVAIRLAQPDASASSSASSSLDPNVLEQPQNHFAQCWNYRYSGAYGSPEYSLSHPGVIGHDPLAITRAVLREEGWLFLEIPELQRCSQLHLRLQLSEDRAAAIGGNYIDLFATVHELAEPLEDYPDYRPIAKSLAPHPMDRDLALAAQRRPNPWLKKLPRAREIRLETGKNLTYVQRRLKAKAGETLSLVLVNPDVVPHNWALVKPGTLVDVGHLANHLVADPDAFARHYIPRSDNVLIHTDVVGPGEEFRIYFTAPPQPGRYPYLCTFPGHWMVMNGELHVE